MNAVNSTNADTPLTREAFEASKQFKFRGAGGTLFRAIKSTYHTDFYKFQRSVGRYWCDSPGYCNNVTEDYFLVYDSVCGKMIEGKIYFKDYVLAAPTEIF